jgi:hypothetical protein
MTYSRLCLGRKTKMERLNKTGRERVSRKREQYQLSFPQEMVDSKTAVTDVPARFELELIPGANKERT